MNTPAAADDFYTGRVVVVTGAGRGIGTHIAERFGQRGAHVVLIDRDTTVKDTAGALADKGLSATGVVADVTSETDVTAAFADIQGTHGRLDVLVNNAGIITIAKIEDLSVDEWRRVLEVNTTGMFLCCKAAIGPMRQGGFGRIINAASGQARQGFIYTPHYAASKFGVLGLTQSLAKELARESITVNAFCPGIVATDMWSYNDEKWGALLGDYQPGELMNKWIEEIPMGRPGSPDDIADLLLFLASGAASYITGQAINIDGGMFMN